MMNRIVTLYPFLFTLLLFSACSTTKVLNSWKSDNVSDVRDNHMLVIARTNNKSARIAFENEIVKELTKRGIKATASFEKIPTLNPDKEITEQEQKNIKKALLDSGFNGVVLTIVKEEQELTKTVSDGGYYAGSTYYGYYPRYYNGFYRYYSHPMSYSTLGNYVDQTTITYTAKNYILETVIYDLDKTDEQQLVAIVTSKLEDPENVESTAKNYVKAISKSLTK